MNTFRIISYFIFFTFTACRSNSTDREFLTNEGDMYTFHTGENTLSIDAGTGGRIVSYTCNGKEFLSQSSVNDINYGSTLWPSPQSNWGWPPYEILDRGAYHVQIIGDTLRLLSQNDSISGYRFGKDFYINKRDSSVNIRYSISNVTDVPKQVAPWDVCRTGGALSFFPVGEAVDGIPVSNLKNVSVEDGLAWYAFDKDSIPKAQKLFSTARGGWLAHVYDGILFIKTFPELSAGDLPPGQGAVEIFAQADGSYIELENHGKYTLLHPGETLVYPEKWYLISLRGDTKEWSKGALLQTVKNKIN